MDIEQKKIILESIGNIAPSDGAAESELSEQELKLFLPLESYNRMWNPNTFLITGGRGTGKTRLFKVITSRAGYPVVFDRNKYIYGCTAPQNPTFIIGFDNRGKKFPQDTTLSGLLLDSENPISYWAGSICFLIIEHYANDADVIKIARNHFSDEILSILMNIDNLRTPSKWIDGIKNNPEMWGGFLDDLDDHLEQRESWVFITYDALDKVCANYQDLFPFIRALLSFWFMRVRRWNHLKAKIFLRTDLFNADSLNFPDSSKLRPHSIELEWNVLSLYRMLVKRIANSGDEARKYLNDIDGLILPEADASLGYMPCSDENKYKEFMQKLVGKYMGKDPKRGFSYTWISNHIQDAKGIISPRPFLKCFTFSASAMLGNPKEIEQLEGERLLSPSLIQGAIADVSMDRVAELNEEYPWLSTLQPMLNNLSMLADKNEFVDRIDIRKWNEQTQKTLPGKTANEILNELEKLGIVYIADDGRVNVPEIYLHGFGMRRRGGIKRPK